MDLIEILEKEFEKYPKKVLFCLREKKCVEIVEKITSIQRTKSSNLTGKIIICAGNASKNVLDEFNLDYMANANRKKSKNEQKIKERLLRNADIIVLTLEECEDPKMDCLTKERNGGKVIIDLIITDQIAERDFFAPLRFGCKNMIEIEKSVIIYLERYSV